MPQLPCLAPPAPPEFAAVRIKAQPEDFIVEELPLYEPAGSGTHTYLWVEKRGLNTLDAVRRLASRLGKRAADAGVAGLKDAQAVTRQWISFEHVAQKPEELLVIADSSLRVLKAVAHGNKLKMGHLRGNRFVILIRLPEGGGGLAAALAARAAEILALLHRAGLPNYFGPQRFGWGGQNGELGQLLVRGDSTGFEKLYGQLYGGRQRADRRLRNLLVNAFQSELFNRVLALRMPGIGRLQAGDLACLHRNGAVFKVATAEDAAKEQPRADAFEISPSGPLFGPYTPLAEELPGAMERQVLEGAGVTLEDFGRPEAGRQPGARRPLRVPLLEEPLIEPGVEGVLLRFALPSGSYASVVLREIVGTGLHEE